MARNGLYRRKMVLLLVLAGLYLCGSVLTPVALSEEMQEEPDAYVDVMDAPDRAGDVTWSYEDEPMELEDLLEDEYPEEDVPEAEETEEVENPDDEVTEVDHVDPPEMDLRHLDRETLEQYLSQAPFIIQRDTRYRSWQYQYRNGTLGQYGCGPSSVCNSLIAFGGVQTWAMSDRLLQDLLWLLTPSHEPYRSSIDMKYFPRINEAEASQVPAVFDYMTSLEGEMVFTDQRTDADTAMALLGEGIQKGRQDLLLARIYPAEQWGDVLDVMGRLSACGQGQALVGITMASAGTYGTWGPFRTEPGHYVTLCTTPEIFLNRGTMYLLDSSPRALPEEELVSRLYYHYYALKIGTDERFDDWFELTHLQPSVVRFEPKEDVWEEISGDISAIEKLMKKVKLFSRAYLTVRLSQGAGPDAGSEDVQIDAQPVGQ